MRNAAFDFSEMTTSVVAVTTDVMRSGKPVVGYSFNSTGRYACGAQMRARFIPRLLKDRQVQEKVQCYVGGGWYHAGKGLEHLQDEIRKRLDEGYTTMKIKVGGASVADDVK